MEMPKKRPLHLTDTSFDPFLTILPPEPDAERWRRVKAKLHSLQQDEQRRRAERHTQRLPLEYEEARTTMVDRRRPMQRLNRDETKKRVAVDPEFAIRLNALDYRPSRGPLKLQKREKSSRDRLAERFKVLDARLKKKVK
jgi:hypothetical protein